MGGSIVYTLNAQDVADSFLLRDDSTIFANIISTTGSSNGTIPMTNVNGNLVLAITEGGAALGGFSTSQWTITMTVCYVRLSFNDDVLNAVEPPCPDWGGGKPKPHKPQNTNNCFKF